MGRKAPKEQATKEPRNMTLALDLQALYRTDPIAARAKILAAFRDCKGNAVHAADVLGIGHRTILRLLNRDPALDAAVDKIRTAARAAREKQKGKATA